MRDCVRSCHRYRPVRVVFGALLSLIGFFLSATPAHAEQPKLLADVPHSVLEAAISALNEWTVEPVTLAGIVHERQLPRRGQAGIDGLVEIHRARAVVWISPSGTTLTVYDVASGRTLTRHLSSRAPYDQASAAAIALTLKSLLRSTEREFCSEASLALSQPDSAVEYFPGRLAIAMGVGVRTPAAQGVQPTAELAAILALSKRPLAFALRATLGLAQEFQVLAQDVEFAGQLDPDFEFGLDVRWAPFGTRRARVEVLVGGFIGQRAGEAAQLNGNQPVSRRSTNLGLTLGTRLGVRLFGRVYGELNIDARITGMGLQLQHKGADLYTEPTVAVQASFGVRVPIFGRSGYR